MFLMAVKSVRRPVMRSVGEKLRILAEYEEAPHGRKGEVTRRYNVARATIGDWAYARDHDEFGPGSSGQRRSGRRMTPKSQSAEIARLRRELAKSQADREILAAALESAGKAHALLEKLAESAEPEPLRTASEKPLSPTSSTTG